MMNEETSKRNHSGWAEVVRAVAPAVRPYL